MPRGRRNDATLHSLRRHLLLLLPLLSVAATLLLSSCRRELEVYYYDHARVRVDVDWLKKVGQRPGGMTLLVYRDGDAQPRIYTTNDVDQHYISLPEGHYRMVIMNKTFSEFAEAGYINFEHPESFWLFMARAVSPWKQQYGLALSQRREQASPLDSTFVFMAPPGWHPSPTASTSPKA